MRVFLGNNRHYKWCKIMLQIFDSSSALTGVNFIIILRARFSYESALCSFSLVTFWLRGKNFEKKTLLYEKRVRKMLIKLTTVLVINDFGLLFVLKVANLLSFGASKAVVWKSSFKLVKVQFDPVIWRIFNSIVIENGPISAIIWVFKIYLHQTVRDICICICTWKFLKLAFIHFKL